MRTNPMLFDRIQMRFRDTLMKSKTIAWKFSKARISRSRVTLVSMDAALI